MKTIRVSRLLSIAFLLISGSLLPVTTQAGASESDGIPTSNFIAKMAERDDPTSWFVLSGKRYWIKDGGTFECLKANGYNVIALSDKQLDARPDRAGHRVYCYSNSSKNMPRGALDQVESNAPGEIRVKGWTFDPSVQIYNNPVHVYVGGRASRRNEGHNIGAATLNRSDIGRKFPKAGPRHGFDATIKTKRSGRQSVCAYAINVGPGRHRFLGCKTVTIKPVTNVVGSIDRVEALSRGQIRVRGWTLDKAIPRELLSVHVYVGGRASHQNEGHNLGRTDVARADVARAVRGAGEGHGFDATISTARRGRQDVCIYGITSVHRGNRLLGCRSVDIPAPSLTVRTLITNTLPVSGAAEDHIVYRVRVKVVDEFGQPVRGASIEANEESLNIVTSATGVAYFGVEYYPERGEQPEVMVRASAGQLRAESTVQTSFERTSVQVCSFDGPLSDNSPVLAYLDFLLPGGAGQFLSIIWDLNNLYGLGNRTIEASLPSAVKTTTESFQIRAGVGDDLYVMIVTVSQPSAQAVSSRTIVSHDPRLLTLFNDDLLSQIGESLACNGPPA